MALPAVQPEPREVEETLLVERRINVSYKFIHRWIAKFGPQIARNLRRDKPDLTMFGIRTMPWSNVLEPSFGFSAQLISTAPFSKKYCKNSVTKRLLSVCYNIDNALYFVPKRIITDKLRCYSAVKTDVTPNLVHW